MNKCCHIESILKCENLHTKEQQRFTCRDGSLSHQVMATISDIICDTRQHTSSTNPWGVLDYLNILSMPNLLVIFLRKKLFDILNIWKGNILQKTKRELKPEVARRRTEHMVVIACVCVFPLLCIVSNRLAVHSDPAVPVWCSSCKWRWWCSWKNRIL